MDPADDTEVRLRELELMAASQTPAAPPTTTRRLPFRRWIVYAVLAVGVILCNAFAADLGKLFHPQAHDPIRVTGTGVSQRIDCDVDIVGDVVSISGSSNNVTIDGHCAELSVIGDRNVVNVYAADRIHVVGAANDIVYTVGLPVVTTTNESNVVHGA